MTIWKPTADHAIQRLNERIKELEKENEKLKARIKRIRKNAKQREDKIFREWCMICEM